MGVRVTQPASRCAMWEPPSQSEIQDGRGHGMGKDSTATPGSWAVASHTSPDSSGGREGKQPSLSPTKATSAESSSQDLTA